MSDLVQTSPMLDHATRVFTQTDLACFVRGTRIETASGQVMVEDIADGTLVMTADHGLQPVRRVLSKTVAATGDLAPICIAAGTLGNDRDLLVSPHHRMVLSGWQAELLTGEPEVLVAAGQLATGSDRIYRQPMETVDYFHLLFDRHEIIFAEGAATESYHPLSHDANERAPGTQAELATLFPELLADGAETRAARPCIAPHEAALFHL